MGKLVKSTITVLFLSAIGYLLTFCTNILIAKIFGAGFEMDSYLVAIGIPSYVVTILSGTLSITFIPVFAEYKSSNPIKAWSIVNSIINLAFICLILLSLVVIFFSYSIIKVAAPGFSAENLGLSSNLLKWYAPVILFVVMNELFASIYYSHDMFFVPMLNKIVSPLVMIVFLFLFSSSLSVFTLVIATLCGALLQFFVLALGIFHNPIFSYSFQPSLYNAGVKKVLLLMAPLIIGMLVYKILPVFDRMILSSLPQGSISHLNYANKLQSSMIQIIATSFSIPIFPLLASISAEKKWVQLKEMMSKIIRIMIFVSLPFAIYFAIAGESIIRVLFQRGAFTSDDTIFVYRAFVLYMISLPVVAIGGVVSQGLYVLQDTKTPVIVGFVETALYIGLCFLLLPYLHYLAIPISYGFYFTFSVVVLGYIFRNKIGLGGGKALFHSVILNLVLSVTIGGIFWVIIRTIHIADILLLCLCVLFIIIYFGSAKLLHIAEAQTLWEKLYALFFNRKTTTITL